MAPLPRCPSALSKAMAHWMHCDALLVLAVLASVASGGDPAEWPGEHVEGRRLANIPLSTVMRITLASGSELKQTPLTTTVLYAGLDYSPVVFDMKTSSFGSPADPSLRIVSLDATDAVCLEAPFGENVVAAPFGTEATGESVGLTVTGDTIGRTDSPFVFSMGGNFRFCYSDDASWATGHSDVIEVALDVKGVYTDCSGALCLETEAYNCYVLKLASNAPGSCALDVGTAGRGFNLPDSTEGKATWTEVFNGTFDEDGMEVTVVPKACGSSSQPDSGFFSLDSASDRYREVANLTGTLAIPMAQTASTLQGVSLQPFAVAACYCAGINSCSQTSDFVQQIGIIYYWLTKVCLDPTCSSEDFVGVIPKQHFFLKVECPPGGCNATTGSRVKFVKADTTNDLPSWDISSGCGMGEHSDRFSPMNCESATSCMLDGGMRQDYKTFPGDNQGFVAPADEVGDNYQSDQYDLRNLNTQAFDVCYCNGHCDLASSWFKAGEFETTALQLVAQSAPGEATSVEALQVLRKPGTIGFQRNGSAAANTIGLQEGGIVKLIWDPGYNVGYRGCTEQSYWDPAWVTDTFSSSTTYVGVVGDENGDDRIIFNGGNATNTIVAEIAGPFAVCYCTYSEASTCDAARMWTLAATFTVRGPYYPSEAEWECTTGLTCIIDIWGFGFESSNRVRVLDSSTRCEDDDGNPGQQDPSVLINCPDCVEPTNNPAGRSNAVVNLVQYSPSCTGSPFCRAPLIAVDTYTLAHETSKASSKTLLTFAADPGLEDGADIVLGPEVVGGTEAQNAALRGEYPYFANEGSYVGRHTLVRHEGSKTQYVLYFGFLRSEAPEIQVVGGAGTWRQVNWAIVQVLPTTRIRSSLRLCWAHSEQAPHVQEVARLSVTSPPTMPRAVVSMSSSVLSTPVPTIIAFQTGYRSDYEITSGYTELRLVVRNVDFFELLWASGQAIAPQDHVNKFESSRTICGQLFTELVSDDGTGFPYPSGCYFGPERRVRRVRSREFILRFESGGGLAPGVNYQMVTTARASPGIRAGDEVIGIYSMEPITSTKQVAVERGSGVLTQTPLPRACGDIPRLEALEVLPEPESEMTDFLSNFSNDSYWNESWMMNDSSMDQDSMGRAFNLSMDDWWNSSYNDDDDADSDSSPINLPLYRSLTNPRHPLELRLIGSNDSAPITADVSLRVLFQPLTAWELGATCVATCVAAPGAWCGSIERCLGESMVPQDMGGRNNKLMLHLPGNLTPIDDIATPIIQFWALNVPPEGLYPTSLGAEIIDSTGRYAQHLRSTGAFIYKLADPQRSAVGNLIFDDPDYAPLRGDTNVVLNMRLVLSSTLRSTSDGLAGFSLNLPRGYSCNLAGALLPTQYLEYVQLQGAPSRVGKLSASFDQVVDGDWKFNDQCTYTLRENSVIYAGATLLLDVGFNFPNVSLSASSDKNVWSVQPSSYGDAYGTEVSMPASKLGPDESGTTRPPAYAFQEAATLPVLGHITEAVAQPHLFTPSTMTWVNLFARMEHRVGIGAMLVIHAAPLFFFNEPCEVQDLADDSAYGAASLPAMRTLRLPGISGCSIQKEGPVVSSATIRLSGTLEAGRLYGWQLRMTTPAAEEHRSGSLYGWRFATKTLEGEAVDSTGYRSGQPQVGFNPLEDVGPLTKRTWSIYLNSIASPANVLFSVASYLPFSMTGSTTIITVSPLSPIESGTYMLRIMAPVGYEWITTSNESYHFEVGDPMAPAGITAELPGGLPMPLPLPANELRWESATYDVTEIYGFSAEVRIPDTNPMGSSNMFFVEFGTWSSRDIESRHAAGAIPAADVRALRSAEATYSSRVGNSAMQISLQIHSVTEIPIAGGLLITAPAGFIFAGSGCTARRPAALALICTPLVAGDAPQQMVVTNNESLAAGLYHFIISAESPAPRMYGNNDTTACGKEDCWTFQSVEWPVVHGNPSQSSPAWNAASAVKAAWELDRAAAAPALDLLDRMESAYLVPLTEAQELAVGRNDRPGQRSQLVFAMTLSQNYTSPTELHVSGPAGFLFAPNCTASVVTAWQYVFGSERLWPADANYTAWPQELTTTCMGMGNTAVLRVSGRMRMLFRAGLTYAWRMEILSNPSVQALDNSWTLATQLEASEEFPSFNLRVFSHVSIRPTSLPFSSSLAGADQAFSSTVFLRFRPYTELARDGYLTLQAPLGFTFIGPTSSACFATLTELSAEGASEMSEDAEGESVDVMCALDSSRDFVVTVQVARHGRVLRPTRTYLLRLEVQTPATPPPSLEWVLRSARMVGREVNPLDDAPLDELIFNGMPLVPSAPIFSVFLPRLNGALQNEGLEEVPGLQLLAMTPVAVLPGDKFQIISPPGFSIQDSTQPGSCRGFHWATDQLPPRQGVPSLDSLPDVEVSCSSMPRLVEFTYGGSMYERGGAYLAFRINTTNPRETPASAENVWQFEHLRGNAVVSASLIRGYDIAPQLEMTEVALVGPAAATALSTLRIRFQAVSQYDSVEIAALAPIGFDFGSVVVSSPAGASARTGLMAAVEPIANAVTIAAAGSAGDASMFLLGNVTLGSPGGQTRWSIQTYLAGQPQDHKLLDGFLLPGAIMLLDSGLDPEQGLTDAPTRSALQTSLLAGWLPRRSRPFRVEMVFHLSVAVPVGSVLTLNTGTEENHYVIDSSSLQMFVRGWDNNVPVELDIKGADVNLLFAWEVSFSMNTTLAVGTNYYLIIEGTTPAAFTPIVPFRLRSADSVIASSDPSMLTNTNDIAPPSFTLVEGFTMQVSTPFVPPRAELEILIEASFGVARPNLLHIVPMESYQFSSSCKASTFIDCQPSAAAWSAYVALTNSSLFEGSVAFSIKATTPPAAGQHTAWLIEGLAVPGVQGIAAKVAALSSTDVVQVGWGEDATGIQVSPMQPVLLDYGAVQGITTFLAVIFDVVARPHGLSPDRLTVEAPLAFSVTCNLERATFVSLPSATCTNDPLTLAAQPNTQIPVGQHIVAMTALLSKTTPSPATNNLFKLRLFSGSSQVIDGNLEIPGKQLQRYVNVETPQIFWTNAAANSRAPLSVRFNLQQMLPPTGILPQGANSDVVPIRAILLELPPDFAQDIANPGEVLSVNENFPKTADTWAEYDTADTVEGKFRTDGPNFRKIRFLRDPNIAVNAGTYEFAFNIVMPSEMPSQNMWRLSFCETAECADWQDSDVVISFVIPGFTLNQVSDRLPADGAPLASLAWRQSISASAIVVALALLFLR